ncbi:MAG: hypothetical protein ACK5RL_21050 [Acidimicrobiales bacterium]
MVAAIWTIRICLAGGVQQAVAVGHVREERGFLFLTVILGLIGSVVWFAVAQLFLSVGLMVTMVGVLCVPAIILTEWSLGVVALRHKHLANATLRSGPEGLRFVLLGLLAWLGFVTIDSVNIVSIGVLAIPAILTILTWYRCCHDERMRPDLSRFVDGHGGAVARLLSRRLDQLVLLYIASPSVVGIYAVAVGLAEAPFVAAQAVQSYLSRSAADDGGASSDAAVRFLALSGIAIGLAGIALSPFIVPVLFGENFHAAIVPTVVLLAATPALMVASGGGALLAGSGGARREARTQAVGVTLNILLLVLFKKFEATGAAFASLVSYSFTAIVIFIMIRQDSSNRRRSSGYSDDGAAEMGMVS